MYYYSPFRNTYANPKEGCPFCSNENIKEQQVLYPNGTPVENEHYRWIINWYPKFEGHTLIVPKRHVAVFGEETDEEVVAREALARIAAQALQKLYPGAGIEYFIQNGLGSESSIPHLHYHMIPAQKDDPMRGFDKLGQFFTIEEGKERVVLFPLPIKLAKEELRSALSTVLQ